MSLRLAISNLAWPTALDSSVFARLPRLGVAGVEVALTRIAGWDALSIPLLRDYRHKLETAGLVVSSLQAVLFDRPNLQLLGDGFAIDEMAEHMRRVTEYAAVLGAKVLVFGAPRNRLKGELAADVAWARARHAFRVLGEITFAAGVTIGIEPVPAVYGADFLRSWVDVLGMVNDVDHPGVRVHLDTGCVTLGGDSIEAAILECKDLLTHFHVAQPQLGTFRELMPSHSEAASALGSIGYDRWVAIEMREQSEDPIAAVEEAVARVSGVYI